MDEIEWWEFDNAKELAEQAAGDIGFVIESAVEAHGDARIALPGEDGLAPVFSALARSRGFDWSKVSLLPTADRLVPLPRERGGGGARRAGSDTPGRGGGGWGGGGGPDSLSLVDESALSDPVEAA